jgi:predicted HicB family RNase H-like nuclease
MKRKPMTFDIDRSPSAAPERTGAGKPSQERQQVGARIPTTLYRQLKAKAGMEGVTVQDLVEQAIRQFMENANAKAAR